jgi:O-antigen/teichoic acid export membrane protein
LFTPFLVPAHWKRQFLLVVLVQLTSATTETIAHYFRGLGRSEIEAGIHAAHRATTLVLGLAVLWWFRRLDYLAIAMLVPAAAALLVAIVIANNLSMTRISEPSLTPAIFFRDVLPLGAGVLISALYFRIDVYFIQYWHGLQPVGGYNAAFRLIEAMRLVPAAALAVTFPLLVQAGDTRIVRRLGGGLAAVGCVLAIGCALGAELIMPAAYGEHYGYAAPAFAILSLALPLFFLNYALTHQVIGWDGQRAYLVIAILALAANVFANFILVPTRGIAGAAISTVLTELIVTTGCVYALVRHERSARRFTTEVPHEGSPKVQHEGAPV